MGYVRWFMRWVCTFVGGLLALALSSGSAGADGRPLVVIDPGHGGSNAGALAPEAATSESQVALAYSRSIADRLRQRGLDVLLTRNENQFLTLRERSKIANERRAAVFVSIHLNASPGRNQRGFETYILSPSGLTVDAPALRQETVARPGIDPDLVGMIEDIERGRAHEASARLAQSVQAELASARPRAVDRGVKQDSMHVLLGATMPAVLVELGFIDHPSEGPELLLPRTRERVADALADAITSFVFPPPEAPKPGRDTLHQGAPVKRRGEAVMSGRAKTRR